MDTKKILMLAGAVFAVTAVAGPAAASGANWTHETEPLEKHVELGLSGGEIFEFGPEEEESGMACFVHATLTTEGGNTAQITEFEVEGCVFGFGELAECELAGFEPLGLPWAVDVNANDLTVTEADIRRTFDAGCPVAEVESTVASLGLTPNEEVHKITEFEMLGGGTAHLTPAATEPYQAFGSFTVDGENSGTYGIG